MCDWHRNHIVLSVFTDTGKAKSSNKEVNTAETNPLDIPLTIKLCGIDGTGPLEIHLAKFDNCSDYYGWNPKQHLCQLKNSLDGQASQVLWQLSKEATKADVIKLLRNPLGNENQAERFRAKLSSRRCKPGETVQSVYNNVRRLLALSFILVF